MLKNRYFAKLDWQTGDIVDHGRFIDETDTAVLAQVHNHEGDETPRGMKYILKTDVSDWKSFVMFDKVEEVKQAVSTQKIRLAEQKSQSELLESVKSDAKEATVLKTKKAGVK